MEAWAEHLLKKEPSHLQNISIFLAQSLTNTTELQKLTTGFLLKEILDRFLNKTTHPQLDPNRVLWIYITNNAAIINLLNSLGLFTVNLHLFESLLSFLDNQLSLFCFSLATTSASVCVMHSLRSVQQWNSKLCANYL